MENLQYIELKDLEVYQLSRKLSATEQFYYRYH